MYMVLFYLKLSQYEMKKKLSQNQSILYKNLPWETIWFESLVYGDSRDS